LSQSPFRAGVDKHRVAISATPASFSADRGQHRKFSDIKPATTTLVELMLGT